MPENFDVKGFVQAARARGISDTQIRQHLEQRGAQPLTPPTTQGFQATVGMQTGADLPQEDGPGLLSRIGSTIGGSFQERGQQFTESRERQAAGEQSVVSSGFQLAGQTVGAGLDIVGAGIMGLARMAPESVKEAVGSAGAAFLETAPAQAGIEALQAGGEVWSKFEEENPAIAANLSALGNIASVIPAGRGAQGAASLAGRAGQPLQRIGDDLILDAAKRKALNVEDFTQGLVQAEARTSRQLEKVVGRMEEPQGAFGRFFGARTITPDASEVAMAQAARNVPGVDANKTLLANYQAIDTHISKLSDDLVLAAQAKNVAVPRQEHIASIRRALDDVMDNPNIGGVSDIQKPVSRIFEKYISFIEANPSNPAGILAARKQFDAWARKNKLTSTGNIERDSANTAAWLQARHASNQIFKGIVDGADESLSTQSNLIRSLDNIAPKVAREATSGFERSLNQALAITGVRNRVTAALAAGAGVGIFGAQAAFATPLMIVGAGIGTGIAANRFYTSPAVRKALGEQIEALGRVTGAQRNEALGLQRELQQIMEGVVVMSARELEALGNQQIDDNQE